MFEDDVKAAFTYAYPLFAFAQTRYRAVQDHDNPHLHSVNTIKHNRDLSDHRAVWITSPNNDTLYSNAWIDLTSGPVRIRAAEMPKGRYWSLAFLDAFTNHFAVVGQRLEDAGPVDFTLLGPEQDASVIKGRVIRAPGQDVWMFCRCLVDGPEDLPQAHAMQDRIEILPPSEFEHTFFTMPLQPLTPANFLEVVNELLLRNPVPSDERQTLESWSAIGVRPGVSGAWHHISEAARCAWSDNFETLYKDLSVAGQKGRRDFNGWIAAAADIGNFGKNFLLRASVALGGLGALETIEAMYFVKYLDETGVTLNGSRQYHLTVPSGGIPAGSFWSFTIYCYTPDGKRVLVENPICRYSIGNRTPDLSYDADGSLRIILQSEAPSDAALQTNWLPTPLGDFHISLRAYLPLEDLRLGEVSLPTVVAVGECAPSTLSFKP